MKLFLTVAGLSVIVIACIRLFYATSSSVSFTQYEKGFVTGNILLIMTGIVMIYFGRKR